MTISSQALRSSFLEFFKKNHHHVERSAPLIPSDDATLLFVNAGMVQFKNVFTQKEQRSYTRATSSQKCVRAGGKHNDLENVGQTARHHTFFEMLGNFSFGDYFKEEAITLAWRFLTEELKLDAQRLSVSVFAGDEQVPADLEAEKIWHEKIGLPKERIKRLGRKDNFWQMGDTGPCGPCTEIHYNRSDVQLSFGHDDLDDKNIEIWNLVFMQYEMLADGSLKPLPAPCVDTGMGLERLVCIANGLPSNYDTDLLRPLIKKTEELSHKVYQASNSPNDMAMRVIADHARATSFLIADGLFPGHEGRSYVLRRIMRRAIRHGAHLGLKEPFFHEICLELCRLMGSVYPELNEADTLLEKVVYQEELAFRKTLDRGLLLFAEQTKTLLSGSKLSGDVVFRLHETYGFPPDLTEDLAKERGLAIDWPEFEQAKSAHEQKSSHGLGLSGVDDIFLNLANKLGKTSFVNQPELKSLKILAIIKDQHEVDRLTTNQSGMIILDRTCFYGESGGQVGDTGTLSAPQFSAKVIDTKKIAGLYVHFVEVDSGLITKDSHLDGHLDWQRRLAIMRNHSATHLLHAALRKILGPHVTQKGSLVAPDKLRFDFSHFEALSKEQLEQLEMLVNQWVLLNEEAKSQSMSIEEAKAHGALALFGEKYESQVRVLDMGSHSIELCGGTHCSRTGDIGSFRITNEGPLAQGIRRLEAITGLAVINLSRSEEALLKDLAKKLGVGLDKISERFEQIISQTKVFERALKHQSSSSLKDQAQNLAARAKICGRFKLVSSIVIVADSNELRSYADFVRDAIGSGIVALGLKQEDGKCIILLAATKDLANQIHVGKIIAEVAPIIGGKGGGRPDFAQAGGDKSEDLALALLKVEELLNG